MNPKPPSWVELDQGTLTAGEIEIELGDLDSLLSGALVQEEEDPDDLEELLSSSTELHKVTQRITGQYAEVLARYASALFAGRPSSALPDMEHTLANLVRLASSTGEHHQVELLNEFSAIVARADRERSPRTRQRHLDALRDWIHRFADTLTPEDSRRLVSTVAWQSGAVPLLDELRSVRGIGPKRLARLYRAGLYTVESVANADPVEVAQATGIPALLAVDVVASSRTFAEAERRRCAVEMRERAARFRNILQKVALSEDPEILDIARTALRELEHALFGEEEP